MSLFHRVPWNVGIEIEGQWYHGGGSAWTKNGAYRKIRKFVEASKKDRHEQDVRRLAELRNLMPSSSPEQAVAHERRYGEELRALKTKLGVEES